VKLDGGFFRQEAARLLATLTRAFGMANLALAEDVVQETLADAFETWSYQGVPPHYAALLTTAAKNRAIDVFRRQRTARRFAPELQWHIESEWALAPAVEAMFLPDALKDDELRMMFTCCHPRLGEDVQVALVLHLLCAFGVEEIASAFLVSPSAIEKRISRGKKLLSESGQLFELTRADFLPRLSAVHRALYLLFNEGYHGASALAVVRGDLCRDAMRLVRLLVDHQPSATPTTYGLAALMWLVAARLPARIDQAGNLKDLFEQDRSMWDEQLLGEGMRFLERSASGDMITEYHVEAAIAGMHSAAGEARATPWADILELYDVLMKIRPSPVVALNRAVAIAQHQGPAKGLEAVRAIEDAGRLTTYPFYPAVLGELELRCGHAEVARKHFQEAHRLARNQGERRFLDNRIEDCTPKTVPGRQDPVRR
jgi:RNA polymerase sigma-70 factor (ECF subfamily)